MNPTKCSIHPAIGIARLGNSPNEFYICPEQEGALPIACDKNGHTKTDASGNETSVSSFKDQQGRIKRQAARFKIFIYDDKDPGGRELKLGDTIYGVDTHGKLVDVEWTVYIANKKAVWYQFQQLEGEHGYAPNHKLRNADITDTNERQKLIIDPGPQTVYAGNVNKTTQAQFARGKNPGYTQSFPPPLSPNNIDTLGEIMTVTTDQQHIQLLVLGGFGNSGSYKQGFGQPLVEDYANNDGWFDDISDGYVTAKLIYKDEVDNQLASVSVQDPSWVVVAYPRYAPQITDMITMDDLLFDLNLREFGTNPYIYGTGKPFSPQPIDTSDAQQLSLWRRSNKRYNPDYFPYFKRDIWPILKRPYYMQYCSNILGISNGAHDINDPSKKGDFYKEYMSVPPKAGQPDVYKAKRQYLFDMLRLPGEENQRSNKHVPQGTSMYGRDMMPLLCGDNPISNTLPSKFLRLTDTQLFFLRQWAEGKFINEDLEDIPQMDTITDKGLALDRGVLANCLGGAFCPGGETAWIIRNPAIFSKPYRINANPDFMPDSEYVAGPSFPKNQIPLALNDLDQSASAGAGISAGLEPGDLTKYSGVPWQTDFNECSTQQIDVTYELWNKLYPGSTGDELISQIQRVATVLWWPAHRPMEVYVAYPKPPDPETHKVSYTYIQEEWARGIPQTYAGDYKMVTEWSKLGFLIQNTDQTVEPGSQGYYYETEYSGEVQ